MIQMRPAANVQEKWNRKWNELGLAAYKGNGERKYYLLEMFAYPSGDLHMGHLRNYVLGDVIHRYRLMNNHDVIHPVGWDAFGLPAEEAAIKRGIAPDQWTMENIKVSSSTLKRMGLLYDWNRESVTCSSSYYRWTQWIFLKLYERGLAYRKKAYVNWCPSCNTVLANEQVEQGNCWRCKSTVEKREKEQWFIRITDYVEDLLKGIDTLKDWPENVKVMQKNWIGRSEGLTLKFPLEKSKGSIDIFTTRPDTLFGVTFMAIAPESEIIESLNIPDERKKAVEKYISDSLMKTEIERTSQKDGKDGVFTGLYAVNPLNGEKIEVWVADYVLASYGTGAVMAVPAHDERDFQFAVKYKLAIKPVIKPVNGEWDLSQHAYTEPGILVNSGQFDGMESDKAIESIMDFIEHENMGKRTVNYRIRDWLVSRQRYWGAPIPMIHCEKCGIVPVQEESLPVKLPDSREVDFIPKGDSPLASSESFINTICPQCGGKARRDPDTMDTFVDSSWYHMRYVDARNDKEIFSRENADEQLPIDMYIGGIEHANGHLIYFRFITKFLRDIGMHSIDEPALRMVNQGMIMDEHGNIMSKSKGNAVPVGPFIDKYGTDIARGTMLFIGPGYKDALWSEDGITGMTRFIDRIVRISEKHSNSRYRDVKPQNAVEESVFIKLNQTIKQVGEDIERFEHNTAIAAIMEMVNMIYSNEESMRTEFISAVLYNVLKMTAVFIPHTSEELFSAYNESKSVFLADWPRYREDCLSEDSVTVVVQVNGKVRAKITVKTDASEEYVLESAMNDENVQRYTDSKEIVKRIFVRNKLLSLVVK